MTDFLNLVIVMNAMNVMNVMNAMNAMDAMDVRNVQRITPVLSPEIGVKQNVNLLGMRITRIKDYVHWTEDKDLWPSGLSTMGK